MARIPLYTGRGVAPSTQLSAAPSVNYSDIRTFDAKAFSAIGSEIENLFNQFNDKRVKTQVANADAEAMFGLTQLQESMKEVDPSQADAAYQQGAQEIYQNLTQNMDDAAISKFHTRWVKLQAIGRVNTFNNGIQRGKTLMVADDLSAYEKRVDSLVPGSAQVNYEMAIDANNESLDALIDARAITPEEGEKLKAQRTDSIRQTEVLNRLNADLTKNPKALEQLKSDLNNPKSFEGLDSKNRAQLLARTQSKIETIETRNHNIAVKKINAAITLVENGADPKKYPELSEQFINENIKDSDRKNLKQTIADVKEHVKVLPEIRNAASADLQKIIERKQTDFLTPTGNADLDMKNLRQFQQTQKFIEHEQKLRRDNLGAVLFRNDSVLGSFNDYQKAVNSGNNPEEFFDVFKMSVDMEVERLGLPRHQAQLLPNQMAKNIAENINKLPPAQAAQELNKISLADPSGQLVSELHRKGKLKDDYLAITSIDNVTSRAMVAQLVQLGGPKKIGFDQKEISQMTDEITTQFDAKFGRVGVVNGAKLQGLKRAVLLLSASKIANDQSGGAIVDHIQDAVEELTPYQVFKGKKIRGIVTTESGATPIHERLLELSLDRWEQKNLPSMEFHSSVIDRAQQGNIDANKTMARAVMDSGIWQLDSTGTTAVLTSADGLTNIKNAQNKEITVDVQTVINDLRQSRRGKGFRGRSDLLFTGGAKRPPPFKLSQPTAEAN